MKRKGKRKIKRKKRLTWNSLKRAGVATVLIPGILMAYYITSGKIDNFNQYYKAGKIFPKHGVVESIKDGDTFDLKSGARVRLLMVDSPPKNKKGGDEASLFLEKLLKN